ncbi:hypothetical protein ACK32K_16155 [Aeromonas dhakensis]|uniref:hypothetical protein n=1 Tax=Aeromonas dhakensis TaxID=196024 RepID=UPI003988521A
MALSSSSVIKVDKKDENIYFHLVNQTYDATHFKTTDLNKLLILRYGMDFLSSIVGKIFDLLGPINNHMDTRRELKDRVLNAICDALNCTNTYYSNISKGMSRDIEKENEISKLWAKAAIPTRHFDQDLAMIFEYKASYWLNPDNWSGEDIYDHGIALERVTYEYQKILAPKAKRVRTEPHIKR